MRYHCAVLGKEKCSSARREHCTSLVLQPLRILSQEESWTPAVWMPQNIFSFYVQNARQHTPAIDSHFKAPVSKLVVRPETDKTDSRSSGTVLYKLASPCSLQSGHLKVLQRLRRGALQDAALAHIDRHPRSILHVGNTANCLRDDDSG